MCQQTWQDVTYQGYPIQYRFSLSSKAEEADIIAEMGEGLLYIWTRHRTLKMSPFYQNLLPLIESDPSSVWPRFEIGKYFIIWSNFDIKIKPYLIDKPYSIEDEKDTYLVRMLKIVDELIEDNEVFKKVDKTKLMEFLSTITEELSPEELASITDDELTKRIEKIMLIEVMSGMLNDLSPKQMESFEEAVKRREFFNELYS